MTLKTEWYFGSASQATSPVAGKTGVVTTVEIRCKAYDDANPNSPVGDVYVSVTLPPPDKDFVEAAEVTTDDLVKWAKAELAKQFHAPIGSEDESAPKINQVQFMENAAISRYNELAKPAAVPFRPKA